MSVSKEDFSNEEKVLEKNVKLIREKISSLGQELYDKDEKILEFKKFMWDSRGDMDPTEMKTMMASSNAEIERMLYKGNYLQKLFKIQNNPYFGSIIFNNEKIYIGLTHLEKDLNHYIHDWRSPICSLFYDYITGPAEYLAPSGIIKGNITNRRQYKIEEAKLKQIIDNNMSIDDDVLQEVLAKESSDKMKNIVNTIQQEQNAVIRNTKDKNLIVQGIAGSGKTSVALHRIAFLLYKIENLNSNNVLIFSPNQIFSEYISNVLPELGEDNTLSTTFHDFANSYISEFNKVETFTKFTERYYKGNVVNPLLVKYKQSNDIIIDMKNYVDELTNNVTFYNDLITRDYAYSKSELNHMYKSKYSKFPLFERLNAMSIYISEQNFNGRSYKSRTILKELLERLNIKKDYKKIYIDFFDSEYAKYSMSNYEKLDFTKVKQINYEDSFLFIYMKGLLEGFNYNTYIKQIVIDEAQDYSILQYILIKKIFKTASYTILGDINQTINPYYKYDSLDEISDIIDGSKYLELTKTYRSSKEIIEYSNKILGLDYVSAIRKENNVPVIIKTEDDKLKESLINDINMLKSKYKSICLITKNDDEASYLYNILNKEYDNIKLISTSNDTFSKQLIIIPSYLSKGLEFDSVIIYTKPNNKYKESEKYLYYVACTRCQHQLIIYNQ